MLAFFDLKIAGMDAEILDELRRADMLDHVGAFSPYNSTAFQHANLALPPWKGSLMNHDADPKEARAVLKGPGSLVIMDDARAALTALGRPPVKVSPQPWAPVGEAAPPRLATLEAVLHGTSKQMPMRLAAVRLAIYAPRRFSELAGELCRHPDAELRRATAWNLGMIAKHRPALVSDDFRAALLRLLDDADMRVRAEAGVACGRAKIHAAIPVLVKLLGDRPADADRWTEDKPLLAQRQTIIETRARYAFALGLMGRKSPAVTKVLVDAVKHRTPHAEMMLSGFDGVTAASALGTLRAAGAVADLRHVLFHETPAVTTFIQPAKAAEKSENPFLSLDKRTQAAIVSDMRTWFAILPALGQIGGAEALAALEAVIDMPVKDSQRSNYLRAKAAESILAMPGPEAASHFPRLLSYPASEVRRFAILACLKKPDPQSRKLLESAAPWAVPWWDVQHGPTGR